MDGESALGGTGVAMLLTLGGFGIWALIDFVMILLDKFTDAEGNPLHRHGHQRRRGARAPDGGRMRVRDLVRGPEHQDPPEPAPANESADDRSDRVG